MRFILNFFKSANAKHDIPAMRLKHAGFSADERKAFREWNSNTGYYR